MRPGQQQQNKRMRGRGGRKGPNPLSRSFESNGPDVKIRGTAQHIADKYTTLARDAAAAGDRVMAENYLQHAEHYGRIVAAAQGQFQPSQVERDYSDFDEEDGEETPVVENGHTPQGQGGERGSQGGQPYGERPAFREGRDQQNQRGDRRENRGDRPFQNRDNFNRDQNRDDREFRRDRQNQPGTGPQPYVQAEADGEAGAPRQDNPRFEGNRRENRRDRPRLNERSGERRFEERFGRPRSGEEARDEQRPAPVEAPEQPHSAEAREPIRTPDVEVAPAVAASATIPVETLAVETADAASAESRGRGRRRREAAPQETQPTAATPEPVVSPLTEASGADAAPAPVRRRTPKAAAPAASEVSEAAPPEGSAPKRRTAKPRRKKDETEETNEGELPAFLLASNG